MKHLLNFDLQENLGKNDSTESTSLHTVVASIMWIRKLPEVTYYIPHYIGVKPSFKLKIRTYTSLFCIQIF